MAGGVVGAGIVALFAAEIAAAAAGIGQELLNAVILLLAVGMLGWHKSGCRATAANSPPLPGRLAMR
jgi:hypothetical protein